MIKDLDRYLKTQSTGPWAANRVAALERSLGELSRMLEEKVTLCDIMVAPSILSGGDSYLKGRPDEKGVVPLAPFLETFGDVRIVMCYLGYC